MIFVLTGPESTGKTSLARSLADRFRAGFVKEQARGYLEGRSGYLPSDLLAIADFQSAAEEAVAERDVGIADTDLQVVSIWWREKYGVLPTKLARAYRDQSPRCYLLCEPDIKWQADPLRENPSDRERLFELYKQDLELRGLPFAIVSGDGDARFDCAEAALINWLDRT